MNLTNFGQPKASPEIAVHFNSNMALLGRKYHGGWRKNCTVLWSCLFYRQWSKSSRRRLQLSQFLWWPGSNLKENREECQMVVHFLGVPSSPACSNSALHKMVDDNSNHYPREVIKNFNVNNCLKFLPSTTDASQYITDLQSMLSRGGSWLQKWVGNSHSDFDAMREAGILEK